MTKNKLSFAFEGKTAMWISTICTTLVILGYAAAGDSEAIAIFGLSVLLTSLASKNLVVIMLSGIFFTALATLTLGRVESFENSKVSSTKKAKVASGKLQDSPKADSSDSEIEEERKEKQPAAAAAPLQQVNSKMGGILDQTSNRLDNINSMIDRVEGLMGKLESFSKGVH